MIRPEKTTFHKGLVFWRKKRGLTQLQLAIRTGVTETTIQRLEKPGVGRDGPTLSTAIAIARALQVGLMDLLPEGD